MDYTLMHYNVMVIYYLLLLFFFLLICIHCMIDCSFLVQAWEGRAYDYCMENLRKVGFPVDGLAFDPDLVSFSNKF